MRVRALGVGLVAALLPIAIPALADGATTKSPGYSVQLLHWNVKVGPGERTRCNVIGQLYRPDSATKQHPAPAILTTNGFGGSYNSQTTLAQEFAQKGYVVLAYSGLGFGGSSCRITLDSTQWDGEAASDLVTFLGGGSKATNGTSVNYVRQQKHATNGKSYRYDPVVGMVGGSYGGEVQFAAAADDPRIDAIVPMVTWNNLAYSLAPNNASISPTSVTYTMPGVTKLSWLNLFWLSGSLETTPTKPYGGATNCPNFSAQECPAQSNLVDDGYPDKATLNLVKDDSVNYYMSKIKAPTLLMQGEYDTLFTLHEAVSTYASLRKQHTPVKLVWQSWGHSNGSAAQPGELGQGAGFWVSPTDHTMTIEGQMVLDWFNYYLRHRGSKPALNFSFYRPWVHYPGDEAAHAYASAGSYPVGDATNFYLSGQSTLASTKSSAQTGSSSFTTPAAGAAESVSDYPLASEGATLPPISDPAGTYAAYESAPLVKTLSVVGIPTVTLTAKAPAGELLNSSGPVAHTLGLYVKLEDVSPNGTATLPDRLISAIRIPDNGKPVKVYLPGIVHQFHKGDRLKLIIAGSDESYFLADPDTKVTVSTSAKDPGMLSLPVISKAYPVKLYAK